MRLISARWTVCARRRLILARKPGSSSSRAGSSSAWPIRSTEWIGEQPGRWLRAIAPAICLSFACSLGGSDPAAFWYLGNRPMIRLLGVGQVASCGESRAASNSGRSSKGAISGSSNALMVGSRRNRSRCEPVDDHREGVDHTIDVLTAVPGVDQETDSGAAARAASAQDGADPEL